MDANDTGAKIKVQRCPTDADEGRYVAVVFMNIIYATSSITANLPFYIERMLSQGRWKMPCENAIFPIVFMVV